MKILLLNTSDRTGGAAVAANRLMQALRKQGVQADMLVRDLTIKDEHIQTVNQSGWIKRLNRFRFYWERLIIFLCNHFCKSELFRVSIANTGMVINPFSIPSPSRMAEAPVNPAMSILPVSRISRSIGLPLFSGFLI